MKISQLNASSVSNDSRIVEIRKKFDKSGADFISALNQAVERQKSIPAGQSLIGELDINYEEVINKIVEFLLGKLKEYEAKHAPKTWIGKLIKKIFG